MQTGRIYKNGKWWVVRYRVSTLLPDGKVGRKQITKRLALIEASHRGNSVPTSVAAIAKEILAPVNVPGAVPETSQTASQFFEHVFIPYCRTVHKPSTVAGYTEVLKLVKRQEAFCGLRLAQIRTADVHQFLKLTAGEKTQTGKQRSRNSMRNVRNFLSAAFTYAKNLGLVAENPVHDVITPKGAAAKETHAYTLGDVHAMLAVLEEPAKTLALTAALTGLRRSELQGLRWEDFTGDTLKVNRAVWNGQVTDTKTAGSKASVPLLPILSEALAEHKARNGYNDWTFHGETGQPLRLDNFTKRAIIRALTKAGLTWHGWHAFRRGLATNLYELGCPAKVAQAILRHANVSTTMDFYIKTRPEETQAAMAKLGEAFKKSERKQKSA